MNDLWVMATFKNRPSLLSHFLIMSTSRTLSKVEYPVKPSPTSHQDTVRIPECSQDKLQEEAFKPHPGQKKGET